jgi:hypothetical protein
MRNGERCCVQEFHCSDFPARVRKCAVKLGNLPSEILWSSDWRFFKNNNLNAICPILSRATFRTEHGSRAVVTESLIVIRFASFYPRSQRRLQNVSLLDSQCIRCFFFSLTDKRRLDAVVSVH